MLLRRKTFQKSIILTLAKRKPGVLDYFFDELEKLDLSQSSFSELILATLVNRESRAGPKIKKKCKKVFFRAKEKMEQNPEKQTKLKFRSQIISKREFLYGRSDVIQNRDTKGQQKLDTSNNKPHQTV